MTYSKLLVFLLFLPSKLLSCHSRPPPSGYHLPFNIYWYFPLFLHANLCLAHLTSGYCTLHLPNCLPLKPFHQPWMSLPFFPEFLPHTSHIFSWIFYFLIIWTSFLSEISDLALNHMIVKKLELVGRWIILSYSFFQSLFRGIVLN